MVSDKQTLFIVEDDVDLQAIYREILCSDKYNILSFKNGKEALDALQTTVNPFLVLLDLRMPIMNGEEFISALVARYTTPPFPIILISATPSNVELPRVVRVMRKPPDFDELLSLIEDHLVK